MTVSDGTQRTFRRSCAICSGTNGKLLYQQRFTKEGNASFLEGYDVVVCGTCGFVFADGIPDQQWFDTYYGAMSKYEGCLRGRTESKWETEKMQAIAQTLIAYVPNRSSQIVDIGCSTGRLLTYFHDAGFQCVLGVDPSHECARFAIQRYGINVKTATFSSLDLPKDFADVIILTGVLEHLNDLDQAIDKISYFTKSNGRVFVSVPNASRYADGEDAPFQEFSMEHINFFGPVSLSNLMLSRGFILIDMIEDVLTVNHRTSTPVLHGIFCKADKKNSKPFQIIKDTKTITGLRSYINKCQSEDKRIRNVIDELVQEKIPLLIWGTGTHTLRLLSLSSLGQANIMAFIDGNPHYHGCTVLNRPVLAPKVLPGYPDVAVLISTRAYQEEIALQIRQKLGCTNRIIRLYP